MISYALMSSRNLHIALSPIIDRFPFRLSPKYNLTIPFPHFGWLMKGHALLDHLPKIRFDIAYFS